MIGLTLKHIRYFEALATHCHFGRAAEACAISQPALSLQIKELEALLGAPLVERAAREIRLTPLGEDFLIRAQDILVRVDDLGSLARSATGPLTGRLRIGVIPTIAPYLLPDVITSLSGSFPQLELQPRESVTHALIADLMASRLDVAIVALPVSEPSLHEFPLFKEEFFLIRPASETGAPVPSPDTLREMRLLLLEEGHCFRDQALSFCDPKGVRAKQIMEGSSLSTLVRMVGAGIGVTLIPEMALAFETRSANVSVSRFDAPRPTRTVGMIWRRTNPLGKQLQEVGEAVRTAASQHRSFLS